jgi:hypothetical protein
MAKWQFRKSKSLLGGLVKLNLSKKGLGYSIGVPGIRISRSADRKIRRTLSIPGTGLRKTELVGKVPARRRGWLSRFLWGRRAH